MSKYGFNAKDYNSVVLPAPQSQQMDHDEIDDLPSCFYDFASQKKVGFGGYRTDLEKTALFDELQGACKGL